MPIADDWDIDYVNTEIRHVDGILSYDGNTGTAPALNDYVIGGTSGAVGRIIAGSDLGGVAATGTLTLTSVVGRFADNETLRVLSRLNFDQVTAGNGGFKIGDTITGPTTESIDVKAIEYNEGPTIVGAGDGAIYGDNLTTGFADGEQLDVSGGTANVAKADAADVDNSALFPNCLVNGTLAVPGTANTNNSIIVHYDGGTVSIPEDAKIADATSGANGFVQQKRGVVATGSLRLIDSDTTGGAWTNDNGINLEDVVFWNAQVAGEVFQEGDIIEGQTSGFRFRVLAGGIIDDGDNTGKLITAGKNGTLTLNEDLHRILPGDVLGPKIAQLESTTTVLAAATLNIPNGVRTEQRSAAGVSQGGIYGITASLNIRRSSNSFFSYIKDTFDELGQLDDKAAIDGNVRDQLYTILSDDGWEIPTLSFRFLEKGAWKDQGNNNVWTNYKADAAVFTGKDIGDHGFFLDATNPTPMPTAYCEQNGLVLDQFWLEGPFDVILQTKTTRDTRIIDPATPALGQLINGGNVAWFTREWGRLYSHFDNSAVGQVAVIVLGAPDDADNKSGQYRYSFNTGGAGAFTVGEEISTSDGTKIGIVMASDTGATGNVDYALKTDTQFADTDVITGAISAKSATLDAAGLSNLVAGYNADIRTMVVDIVCDSSPAPVITGTFIVGESVTQAVTGATGFVLEADTNDNDKFYLQNNTGTFSGDNTITGDTSGATWNPGVTTQTYNALTTVPKDLGEGSGDLNYSGVTGADITGGNPRTIAAVYEWDKFLTRKESTSIEGGRGSAAGVQGRIYRGFDSTFAEKIQAPYGTIAGGIMFGAQGHFIDKDTLVSADIQKIRLIPNAGGDPLVPPNLQTATIGNLQSGWRAGFYRSTGAASEDILTTEFQAAAGNAAANTTVVVQAGTRSVGPLPADVPDTGVLRVEDPSNAGIFLRMPYNAVNRSTNTFTLTSGTIGDVTGGVALTQGDDIFVCIIEEQAAGATVSNNVEYIGDINTVVIARKKGFDDFISAGTFGSTGQSTNIVRTADGVVNLP